MLSSSIGTVGGIEISGASVRVTLPDLIIQQILLFYASNDEFYVVLPQLSRKFLNLSCDQRLQKNQALTRLFCASLRAHEFFRNSSFPALLHRQHQHRHHQESQLFRSNLLLRLKRFICCCSLMSKGCHTSNGSNTGAESECSIAAPREFNTSPYQTLRVAMPDEKNWKNECRELYYRLLKAENVLRSRTASCTEIGAGVCVELYYEFPRCWRLLLIDHFCGDQMLEKLATALQWTMPDRCLDEWYHRSVLAGGKRRIMTRKSRTRDDSHITAASTSVSSNPSVHDRNHDEQYLCWSSEGAPKWFAAHEIVWFHSSWAEERHGCGTQDVFWGFFIGPYLDRDCEIKVTRSRSGFSDPDLCHRSTTTTDLRLRINLNCSPVIQWIHTLNPRESHRRPFLAAPSLASLLLHPPDYDYEHLTATRVAHLREGADWLGVVGRHDDGIDQRQFEYEWSRFCHQVEQQYTKD